jgi:hypothetical protein
MWNYTIVITTIIDMYIYIGVYIHIIFCHSKARFMLFLSVKGISLMMAEQFQPKHIGDVNKCALVGHK